MRLRDRIERIEALIDRPRFGDGGSSGPTAIRIRGGLDGVEPRHATVGGLTITCEPGETEDAFEERAIQRAISENAPFVIFSGMPGWVR